MPEYEVSHTIDTPIGSVTGSVRYDGSLSASLRYGAGATVRDVQAQKYAAYRTTDHLGDFNFRVEIEGLDCGGFKSVKGLELKIEPITYHYSDRRMPMKRPGRPEVGNIVLSKGYVNTDTLWRWSQEICNGKVKRKSGSIVLLDDAGQELSRYNFYYGWPTRWKGFELDGKGQDVMVEELELAVERIERA